MKYIHMLALSILLSSSHALEVKITNGETAILVSINAAPNDVNALGDKIKIMAGELLISRQNRLKEVESQIVSARLNAQKYDRDLQWLMQSVSEISIDINGIKNGKSSVPDAYKEFNEKIGGVIENITTLKKFAESQGAALNKEKQSIEDEMSILGVIMR